MKKICLISDRNIYMKRLCKYLDKEGFNIALICRHYSGISRNEFPEKMKFFQLSGTSFFTKKREINNILKQFKPDIVHLHILVRDALIPVLKWRRKYCYYISVWGSDINLRSQNLISRIIQLFALLFCDKIHLNNANYRQKMIRRYGYWNSRKFHSISWGIESQFFKNVSNDSVIALKKELGIGEGDNIILSHRNHKQIYNHHTLLKSIPGVISVYPNTKFIFTRGSSDQTYVDQSIKIVSDLAITSHFIYLDRWLSDKDIHTLLNISDIAVNIPFMDGLPASLFEIMSTKAIPIVSDLDNYYAFFKDCINGFYLKNITDEQVLVNLIIEALKNLSDYQEQFSKINNRYVARYQNWDIQSQQFLKLYEVINI